MAIPKNQFSVQNYLCLCLSFLKWVQTRWCKPHKFKDVINLSTLCLKTAIYFQLLGQEICHSARSVNSYQRALTHTVLRRRPLLEPRRHWGPVCKPCHVKQGAGWRKMRGVRGRKQLVKSPEDINLRGETGWQERPPNKAWYYCCKWRCVCLSVCLPGGLLVSKEINVGCLCPSGY